MAVSVTTAAGSGEECLELQLPMRNNKSCVFVLFLFYLNQRQRFDWEFTRVRWKYFDCVVLDKVISVLKRHSSEEVQGKSTEKLVMQYYSSLKHRNLCPGLSLFAWSLMLAPAWLHHELDQGADPALK